MNIIKGRVASKKTCVALTGAQCAKTADFEAGVANTAGIIGRISITDGTCQAKSANDVVCDNGMTQGNTTTKSEATMIAAAC